MNDVTEKDIIPIIIPAYEPDEKLVLLVSNLINNLLTPIIIVDDGSGEDYRNIFATCNSFPEVTLLTHPENKGKGRALKTAFKNCIDIGVSGGVTADSDGQHTIDSIKKCKDALVEDLNKLVLGVRDFSGEDIPDKSRFGNNLTKKVFKSLYKTELTDTQTGLRGIGIDYMRSLLDLNGERFEFETRMLIDAIEKGIEIKEVEIETIYDSKENHSTHFRPVVDSIRIYRLFGLTFGRFVLSALSSSIIDLGLFQLFCFLLVNIIGGVKYVTVASVLARIISAVYNYLVNYHFVFKSKSSYTGSAIKYFMLAVIQMVTSALLVTGLVYVTRTPLELFVKIPVDVFLFFVSYQIQKRVVYKELENK